MLMVPSGRWIRAHELGPKRGVWNYKRPGWTPCERGGGFDCASGSKGSKWRNPCRVIASSRIGKGSVPITGFFWEGFVRQPCSKADECDFFWIFFFFLSLNDRS